MELMLAALLVLTGSVTGLLLAGVASYAVAADRPPVPVEPRPGHAVDLDLPDLWGHDSFPASDPPANW